MNNEGMREMKDFSLPYGHQSIAEKDIEAVAAVLRGDWLTMGPAVERFESAVADYVGAACAVSFSSGTAALHGAMHAAGVVPGDRVIVPPLTFAATANAALYCGGEPVFADISPGTLCLDPWEAESVAASPGGPVRVIAPVSFAGFPADISTFRGLSARMGAVIVEDACHALGARRGELWVGKEADMTVFSFHPVKHITTAEGGMVVTDSEEFAKRLRRFRTHGIVKSPADFERPYEGPWDNDMIELGYNYRLSDMASALGESQMRRLDAFVARRRELAVLYAEALGDVSEVDLPPDHPGHSYHIFPVAFPAKRRKEIFLSLRSAGIGVQVHYPPVHKHTYYRRRFGDRDGKFPITETYAQRTISLPMFPDMSNEDVSLVVRHVKEALCG